MELCIVFKLQALVYVSSAVTKLTPDQVEYLLMRARNRNAQYGVTGVLLYIGGNFMQYIEGPSTELAVIYDIIKNDPGHTGLIELMHCDIEQRDFCDWAMAYCTKERNVSVSQYNNKSILEDKLGFSTSDQTSSRTLLRNFWVRNSA